MILYEFEGKDLLKAAGIPIPQSQLIDIKDLDSSGFALRMTGGVVLKAQVLSGKRADVGGIQFAENEAEFKTKLEAMLGSTINNEKVAKVLVEEKVDIQKEYYLSLSYDTDSRSPILTLSQSGGTGIEEREVQVFQIDPLTQSVIAKQDAEGVILGSETTPESGSWTSQDDELLNSEIIKKLINTFFDNDCLLLEINPLVQTPEGFIALDAKIKLDDDARGRHEDWTFEPRLPGGRVPTQNEIDAKKIDQGDYRGTAGSAYFDLDGDIAILSSGGGVSLTAMDALINASGKPANFTEYSGNPPKEKVVKLTKIVLSKPNIHGLWVVGTVAANFTDIYETLSGLIDGLREAEKDLGRKFDFPIVIRRGGPRDKEAFEMLREVKDFDLTLQGEEVSISQSAKIIAEKAKIYAQR